jgi:hypothetical protein
MKKQNLIFLIVISTINFSLISCATIYGYKGFKDRSDKELEKFVAKTSPGSEIFIIDTTKYIESISSVNDNLFLKNLFQPMQLRIYDSLDNLLTWVVNCEVGGFPNLKWNRYINFESIPPSKWYKDYNTNSLDKLDNFGFIVDLSNNKLKDAITNDYDYLFVVFYSLAFERQSKRLIRALSKYSENHPELKIKIIPLFADNLIYQLDGVCNAEQTFR